VICIVYGTRPEVTKLGPIVAHLREMGVNLHLIDTGQQDVGFQGGGLRGAERLELAATDPEAWVWAAHDALRKRFRELGVSQVAVQGDTASVYAGAFAAASERIPVAHIEAGVRSHAAEPNPEESIRVAVAKVAELHLASTETCRRHLEDERVRGTVYVTGSPSVSAVAQYVAPMPAVGRVILVTLHRGELVSDPARAAEVVRDLMAAARLYPHTTFLWPIHPGMRPYQPINRPPNVEIIRPLAYRDMLHRLATARGVLTDSGGLVEEAATLGVPTAILRDWNDRPEAEAAGIARRFSTSRVEDAVVCLQFEEIPRLATATYGTADAARIIATHLAEWSHAR